MANDAVIRAPNEQGPRVSSGVIAGMPPKPITSGLSYAALRKECLDAVRQWPGCETISGIQIIRHNDGGFSVRVILYGTAKRQLADRAMNAVQREIRRYFHLLD